MIRTTLAALDYDQVAAAFNTVYTGYFMPFNVDAGWVARLPERNSIVFAASPIWLDDDGAVIGMAALAVRGERGWVGGFGVAPHFRGRGLSHELAHAMLESARSIGIRRLNLEVMQQNTAAIRVYRRAGFSHVRHLLAISAPLPDRSSRLDIRAVGIEASAELIGARRRMPVVSAAWQREASSLSSVEGLRAVVIGDPSAPSAIGFVVVGGSGIGLVDAAAIDVISARELLAAIAACTTSARLTLWNEPEDSPLVPALYDAGWTEVMRQIEMAFNFDQQ